MTQLRRTKPIFLVLSGVFLLITVVFLVILVINLHIGTVDRANGEVDAENSKYFLFDPTEPLTNQDIIHMYGFYIGEMGQVFDANRVRYVQYDDSIRVLHESVLYIISLEEIKESQENTALFDDLLSPACESTEPAVQPTIPATQPAVAATQKPAPPATESVSSHPQTDSVDREDLELERMPVYEVSPGLEYSQPDNVVHPQIGGAAEDSIKLNPSAISVNKDDSFSLSLAGAGDGVQWTASNDLVEIKQTSGNSCLLKAHKASGSVNVTASYNNKTYTCKVTIN